MSITPPLFFVRRFLAIYFRAGLTVAIAAGFLGGPIQPVGAQSDNGDAPSLSVPSVLPVSRLAATSVAKVPYLYDYRIDSIDPTPASNPAGAQVAGFRGVNQLVLYTPAFGEQTGTDAAGTEATVVNGIIMQVGDGNSVIPPGAFVISGHGLASQWLLRFAQKGAQVALDQTRTHLLITFTPQVYRQRVLDALALSDNRPPMNAPGFQQNQSDAKACLTQLDTMSNNGVSKALEAQAQQCVVSARRAFYDTVVSINPEFRGAWIRPAPLDTPQIPSVISQMKALGVTQIFLETYFQGKTIYPSEVMKAYGLPVQHTQYSGTDPLQAWLDAAHQNGMKVNVWSQIFFAGNQQESAEQYGPILNKYPQWRNIERAQVNRGIPIASDIEPGHYFLDPANPDVRVFLDKLLIELVSRYPVDGVNLDYIRYPASAHTGYSDYYNTTWGYTEIARKTFKETIDTERLEAARKKLDAQREALIAAGQPLPSALIAARKALDHSAMAPLPAASKAIPPVKGAIVAVEPVAKPKPLAAAPPKPPSADPVDITPKNPLWSRWVSWRTAQVSSFVETTSSHLKAIRPDLLMTAVVFPSTDPTYALKLQNYSLWARQGWIQALTPIGLSRNPQKMAQQVTQLRAQVNNSVPVYAGVFALYNREGPVALVRQIEALHSVNTPGLVFFDWSRLYPEDEEALREGAFRTPAGNAESR